MDANLVSFEIVLMILFL